ncbi:MAG TPA: acyl-ACP thioesterase domain-containing protein [Acidimicrobiales bacterium]|nr:acyl-ACP thioesterase domain-containing protein [Acidimicrobiales bacterium]
MADPSLFVPPAPDARTFTTERIVRLGDVNPHGRLRLDALARHLQDVAYDDAHEAKVEEPDTWVVRRLALAVDRLPRWGELVSLTTFCGGTGSRWAERRTTVAVDGRPCVEAAAVWVFVDMASGRPLRIPPGFMDAYGEAATARKIDARLRHPGPPAGLAWRPWPLRATDHDVLGHMNNAAYWEPVEDELARAFPDRRVRWAELEFRTPVLADDDVRLASVVDGEVVRVWLASAGGTVHASASLG